jgi:hypothetical protein
MFSEFAGLREFRGYYSPQETNAPNLRLDFNKVENLVLEND